MEERRRFERWRFTAQGTGEFPWDMLRYDCCHPATDDDARAMTERRRRVTLTAYVAVDAEREVPTARWPSFLWGTGPATLVDGIETRRTLSVSTVTGGRFPTIMLARSKCHPASSDDAFKLTTEDPRTVKLTAYGAPLTTEAADWSEHGWRVDDEAA